MQECAAAEISLETGVAGDHKGIKLKTRQVTLLAWEDWRAALADLDPAKGSADLPWTARRVNLLIERLTLPAASGAVLGIGPVRLEVTRPVFPCTRMLEAHPGLMRALARDWRGGIATRVLEGGKVRLGDPVTVLVEGRPWKRPKLP
jgi:MOSC domain-containing protein YiiM